MKTEHTVGPWKVDIGVMKRNTICAVFPHLGSRPLRVDSVNGFVASEKEEQANARLIAAAPRMYDRIAKLATDGDVEAISIMEAVNGRS